MAQVWLVTGSSRGLGRAIVEAGLAAGVSIGLKGSQNHHSSGDQPSTASSAETR